MRRLTNKEFFLFSSAAIAGIAIISLIIGIFCGYDAMIRYLTGGIWAI